MNVSPTDQTEQLVRLGHDFNDLLTAIIGYTDLSLRRVELDDSLRHNLQETRKAAERAAFLVDQLRSMAVAVKKTPVAAVNSWSESRPV